MKKLPKGWHIERNVKPIPERRYDYDYCCEAATKPTDHEYYEDAVKLALDLVIIKPCIRCGWPVHSGWCCRTCGSGQ